MVSAAERLTNARPTVDDTPRNSLTAQTMSWEAMLVAVVAGLGVLGWEVECLEKGRKESGTKGEPVE